MSNDKKTLDELKFVRLKTQTSHIDCFLTTLMTREILCGYQLTKNIGVSVLVGISQYATRSLDAWSFGIAVKTSDNV